MIVAGIDAVVNSGFNMGVIRFEIHNLSFEGRLAYCISEGHCYTIINFGFNMFEIFLRSRKGLDRTIQSIDDF